METREAPGYGFGYARYGYYLGGFFYGGDDSDGTSPPSYIHKFTTTVINDEKIKTKNAEKSVETGAGDVRSQLKTQLEKHKVTLDEGQITQVAVRATLAAYLSLGTHFQSASLHVTNVIVEPVNVHHDNIAFTLTHAGQTVTQKEKGHPTVVTVIPPHAFQVEAVVTLTKNNPDVTVDAVRMQ